MGMYYIHTYHLKEELWEKSNSGSCLGSKWQHPAIAEAEPMCKEGSYTPELILHIFEIQFCIAQGSKPLQNEVLA